MKKIKFAEVNIKKNDLKLVNKVLTSGWLAHGKYSEELANKYANLRKLNMLSQFQVVQPDYTSLF